jgi:ABC-type transporter Mla subunit MlaD
MDLGTGDLQAPLGAIEHLARTLQALARSFGDRSVASAEIATRDPETTLTLAAREGEPAVLAAGDYEYTLRQDP